MPVACGALMTGCRQYSQTGPHLSSGIYTHFFIGVMADEAQWVIKVTIGSALPPGPPGVGSTINIPATFASGKYAVQLVQVFNTYTWVDPTGSYVGTRPVYLKLKETDTGNQALTVTGEEQVVLTSHGTTYQPQIRAQTVPGCPTELFGTLMPGTSTYLCVTFVFPGQHRPGRGQSVVDHPRVHCAAVLLGPLVIDRTVVRKLLALPAIIALLTLGAPAPASASPTYGPWHTIGTYTNAGEVRSIYGHPTWK